MSDPPDKKCHIPYDAVSAIWEVYDKQRKCLNNGLAQNDLWEDMSSALGEAFLNKTVLVKKTISERFKEFQSDLTYQESQDTICDEPIYNLRDDLEHPERILSDLPSLIPPLTVNDAGTDDQEGSCTNSLNGASDCKDDICSANSKPCSVDAVSTEQRNIHRGYDGENSLKEDEIQLVEESSPTGGTLSSGQVPVENNIDLGNKDTWHVDDTSRKEKSRVCSPVSATDSVPANDKWCLGAAEFSRSHDLSSTGPEDASTRTSKINEKENAEDGEKLNDQHSRADPIMRTDDIIVQKVTSNKPGSKQSKVDKDDPIMVSNDSLPKPSQNKRSSFKIRDFQKQIDCLCPESSQKVGTDFLSMNSETIMKPTSSLGNSQKSMSNSQHTPDALSLLSSNYTNWSDDESSNQSANQSPKSSSRIQSQKLICDSPISIYSSSHKSTVSNISSPKSSQGEPSRFDSDQSRDYDSSDSTTSNSSDTSSSTCSHSDRSVSSSSNSGNSATSNSENKLICDGGASSQCDSGASKQNLEEKVTPERMKEISHDTETQKGTPTSASLNIVSMKELEMAKLKILDALDELGSSSNDESSCKSLTASPLSTIKPMDSPKNQGITKNKFQSSVNETNPDSRQVLIRKSDNQLSESITSQSSSESPTVVKEACADLNFSNQDNSSPLVSRLFSDRKVIISEKQNDLPKPVMTIPPSVKTSTRISLKHVKSDRINRKNKYFDLDKPSACTDVIGHVSDNRKVITYADLTSPQSACSREDSPTIPITFRKTPTATGGEKLDQNQNKMPVAKPTLKVTYHRFFISPGERKRVTEEWPRLQTRLDLLRHCVEKQTKAINDLRAANKTEKLQSQEKTTYRMELEAEYLLALLIAHKADMFLVLEQPFPDHMWVSGELITLRKMIPNTIVKVMPTIEEATFLSRTKNSTKPLKKEEVLRRRSILIKMMVPPKMTDVELRNLQAKLRVFIYFSKQNVQLWREASCRSFILARIEGLQRQIQSVREMIGMFETPPPQENPTGSVSPNLESCTSKKTTNNMIYKTDEVSTVRKVERIPKSSLMNPSSLHRSSESSSPAPKPESNVKMTLIKDRQSHLKAWKIKSNEGSPTTSMLDNNINRSISPIKFVASGKVTPTLPVRRVEVLRKEKTDSTRDSGKTRIAIEEHLPAGKICRSASESSGGPSMFDSPQSEIKIRTESLKALSKDDDTLSSEIRNSSESPLDRFVRSLSKDSESDQGRYEEIDSRSSVSNNESPRRSSKRKRTRSFEKNHIRIRSKSGSSKIKKPSSQDRSNLVSHRERLLSSTSSVLIRESGSRSRSKSPDRQEVTSRMVPETSKIKKTSSQDTSNPGHRERSPSPTSSIVSSILIGESRSRSNSSDRQVTSRMVPETRKILISSKAAKSKIPKPFTINFCQENKSNKLLPKRENPLKDSSDSEIDGSLKQLASGNSSESQTKRSRQDIMEMSKTDSSGCESYSRSKHRRKSSRKRARERTKNNYSENFGASPTKGTTTTEDLFEDMYCKLCSERFHSQLSFEDHNNSYLHHLRHLELKIRMGPKCFNREFGPIPWLIGSKNEDGTDFTPDINSGCLDLLMHSLKKARVFDLHDKEHLLVVVQCGLLSNYRCKVCAEKFEDEYRWSYHISAKSHYYKCMRECEADRYEDFLWKNWHTPGPHWRILVNNSDRLPYYTGKRPVITVDSPIQQRSSENIEIRREESPNLSPKPMDISDISITDDYENPSDIVSTQHPMVSNLDAENIPSGSIPAEQINMVHPQMITSAPLPTNLCLPWSRFPYPGQVYPTLQQQIAIHQQQRQNQCYMTTQQQITVRTQYQQQVGMNIPPWRLPSPYLPGIPGPIAANYAPRPQQNHYMSYSSSFYQNSQ